MTIPMERYSTPKARRVHRGGAMRFCFTRTNQISLLVLLLFPLLIFIRGFGQETASTPPTSPTPPRPKIGLVLEGGGALGLAHIGVIQWLEEHRIPVNYVAGTSMGGLVGGLYATGHSAPEVKALIKTDRLGSGTGRSNSIQESLISPQAGCRGIPQSSGVRSQKWAGVPGRI